MNQGLGDQDEWGKSQVIKNEIGSTQINENTLYAVLGGQKVPDMQQLAKKNYPGEALLHPNMANQVLPVIRVNISIEEASALGKHVQQLKNQKNKPRGYQRLQTHLHGPQPEPLYSQLDSSDNFCFQIKHKTEHQDIT